MRIARMAMLAAAMAAVTSVVANAHETRLVGPNDEYQLVVGFRVEPAFEDVLNGPDLIVTRTSDSRPIDTDAGDVFNVQVEIQLRDHEAFSSSVVQAATLTPPVGQSLRHPEPVPRVVQAHRGRDLRLPHHRNDFRRQQSRGRTGDDR